MGHPQPPESDPLLFDDIMRVQAGTPNSEATHGHRLHFKGLDECRANRILHSTWAEAMTGIEALLR